MFDQIAIVSILVHVISQACTKLIYFCLDFFYSKSSHNYFQFCFFFIHLFVLPSSTLNRRQLITWYKIYVNTSKVGLFDSTMNEFLSLSPSSGYSSIHSYVSQNNTSSVSVDGSSHDSAFLNETSSNVVSAFLPFKEVSISKNIIF